MLRSVFLTLSLTHYNNITTIAGTSNMFRSAAGPPQGDPMSQLQLPSSPRETISEALTENTEFEKRQAN